jgi:hypothetical protein
MFLRIGIDCQWFLYKRKGSTCRWLCTFLVSGWCWYHFFILASLYVLSGQLYSQRLIFDLFFTSNLFNSKHIFMPNFVGESLKCGYTKITPENSHLIESCYEARWEKRKDTSELIWNLCFILDFVFFI